MGLRLWIGSDDEVVDASKVLTWARNAPQATTGTVTDADHFGVVDCSVADVGTWVDRQAAK